VEWINVAPNGAHDRRTKRLRRTKKTRRAKKSGRGKTRMIELRRDEEKES
jgi:hypothetical protein